MKSLYTLIGFVLLSLSVSLQANTYTTITALQADTLIKNHPTAGDLIILDVRTAAEFLAERIDKSKNLDYYGAGFADSLAKLDKNKIYFLYCGSGGRSNAAMNKMRELNFRKVYNLQGGLPSWKSAGLPTIKGAGSGVDPDAVMAISVKLYPNPVTDESILEIIGTYEGEVTVEILNSIGSTVIRKKLAGDRYITIRAQELSAGFYFYRIILPGKVLRAGKFQVAG